MLWVRDITYWAKIGSFINQIFSVLILVLLIQVADLHAQPDTLVGVSGSDKVNPVQIRESFGNLPLYFIKNQDQLDSRVFYYLQGRDKTLFFTSQGITLVLSGKSEQSHLPGTKILKVSSQPGFRRSDYASAQTQQPWVIKLDFIGANPDVKPEGQQPTATMISYFKGPRERWKTGIRTYRSIIYRDLWPGIDLVYTGTVNRLKYRFLVKPGADPDKIRLAYRGATSVGINKAGQLEVTTPVGGFHDDSPYSYQYIKRKHVRVDTAYDIQAIPDKDTTIYGFKVGAYDRSKVLVLDPVILVYCGYIGGSNTDYGYSIAVDGSGQVYITGYTFSYPADGFPVVFGPDLTFNSVTDAFVAKINASGTALLYCGYIGGDSEDNGRGIAVDNDGNAYITGKTDSTRSQGFPVTVSEGPLSAHQGNWDAFVAKVNWNGSGLIYCGYIGGSSSDKGFDITVDALGNAYITGDTYSSEEENFPVTMGPDLTYNGSGDAFVAKVDSSGLSLIYCGYIGGSGGDIGRGIAVGDLGNAYVTGDTTSTETDFPVIEGPDLSHNGNYDGFVAKVNTPGTGLVYCGYIGGSNRDYSRGIAVDSDGYAYIAGSTRSSQAEGFPVVFGPDLTYNGGATDAYVAKVNGWGTALLYCGYIGGSGNDSSSGIAADSDGNAYIIGSTTSTENQGFPVIEGPDLTHNGGATDAFVSKVYWTGSALIYCGYIGGYGGDAGRDIAVDSRGQVYLIGYTDSSESMGFPVTKGPDLTFNGGHDVFVAKISDTTGKAMPWLSLLLLGQPASTSYLFYQGSLAAIDPDHPTANIPIHAAADKSRYVRYGAYPPDKTGWYPRSVVYAQGGKLWRVGALKQDGQPGSATNLPLQLSTESSADDVCEAFTVPDFSDHRNAKYVYILPGADTFCYTPADNIMRMVTMNMDAGSTPVTVPGQLISPLYDSATGGLKGWLLLDTGGNLLRYDSSFIIVNQTLLTEVTGAVAVALTPNNQLFMNIVATGVDEHLFRYDVDTDQLVGLSTEMAGTHACTDSDFLYWVEPLAGSVYLNQIVAFPVDGGSKIKLANEAGANVNSQVFEMELTQDRIVYLLRVSIPLVETYSSIKSVTKDGLDIDTLVGPRDVRDAVIDLFATAGKKVYYNELLTAGGRDAGVVNDDDSIFPTVYLGSEWVGRTWPMSMSEHYITLPMEPERIIRAEGWNTVPGNGFALGRLHSYDAKAGPGPRTDLGVIWDDMTSVWIEGIGDAVLGTGSTTDGDQDIIYVHTTSSRSLARVTNTNSVYEWPLARFDFSGL